MMTMAKQTMMMMMLVEDIKAGNRGVLWILLLMMMTMMMMLMMLMTAVSGGARFGPTCYRVSCRRPILATTCPGQPSAYLRAYVAEIEGGAFDQSGSINWLPKEFVRNNLRCKGALRWCTMAIHFKGRAEPIKIWINLQTWYGERTTDNA